MAVFAEVQYCIYAFIFNGWVGQKVPKMCGCNIWMVPNLNNRRPGILNLRRVL